MTVPAVTGEIPRTVWIAAMRKDGGHAQLAVIDGDKTQEFLLSPDAADELAVSLK